MRKTLFLDFFSKIDTYFGFGIFRGWINSIFFKAPSLLLTFVNISLSISILGVQNYGIWVAFNSIFQIILSSDLGVSPVLRNSISKSIVNKREDLGAEAFYYSLLVIVSLLSVFLVFTITALTLFDANSAFNIPKDHHLDFSNLIFYFLIISCNKPILNLINAFQLAHLKHAFVQKMDFFIQVVIFLGLLIMLYQQLSNFYLYGSIIVLTPILIYFVCFIYLALNNYLNYFSLALVDFYKKFRSYLFIKYLKPSLIFFTIQLASLALFSIDSVLILRLFGPEDVAQYHLTYRFFMINTMLITMFASPHWAPFTHAYTNGDIEWIVNSIKKYHFVWKLSLLLLAFTFIAFDYVLLFLSSSELESNLGLKLVSCLLIAIQSYFIIYTYFVNAIQELRLQFYISISILIFKIPLSIFICKILGIGAHGVLIATCILLFIGSLVIRNYVVRILAEDSIQK